MGYTLVSFSKVVSMGLIAVNTEDNDLLELHPWGSQQKGFYGTWVNDGGKRKFIRLHRLIAERIATEQGFALTSEMPVLFKDGNTSNCTRNNLVIVGRGEVQHKARKSATRNTSKYRGVYLAANGKYRPKIHRHGHTISLGYYVLEEDAARAYDDKSEEWYGDRPNGTKRLMAVV